MAIHDSSHSMIKESLSEYVQIARYCITTEKQNRGVFGYPGALLLFAIADAIGSFFRGNGSFQMMVDGGQKNIRKASEHYFIFNSEYYGLSLSGKEIQQLVTNFRNPLSHNSLLAPDSMLTVLSNEASPFVFRRVIGALKSKWEVPIVHLIPFLAVTEVAVGKFLPEADRIVPTSRIVNEFQQKADSQARGKRITD